MLNLTLNYAFPWLDVHVKGMSLLDRDYEVLPAYPAPGFNAMAGFSYRLN